MKDKSDHSAERCYHPRHLDGVCNDLSPEDRLYPPVEKEGES